MPLPLALQLYSLREAAAKDFPTVLRKTAEMGYAGVEFAGFHGHEPAELAKLTRELGLECVSAHLGVPTEENLAETVETARTLGLSFVVGGGGPDNYKDMASIREISSRFAKAAELLEPHGLRFGIHNHWWEFDHEVEGRCPHEIMMELSGKAFAQVDICWAAFGGHDPVAVIEKNAGRVDLLHVKDSELVKGPDGRPATPHVAVGQGKVDVRAAVAAAERSGTKWLIVELDRCATDMEEAVRQSARFLLENGLARGRE